MNILNSQQKFVTTEKHGLRVEHAQVVALEDIPKFAPLGIVLSMQLPHATSDMPWAETRVGPQRIMGAYAWRSFLDTGVHLTLNSDFPGETLNPFFGMLANFIVLSDDILTILSRDLLELQVEQTYLSGQLVYKIK